MRSKTSCFNLTIYRNWLRRCWPVWGIQIFIWLLLMPIPLLNVGNNLFGGTAANIIRATGGYGGILINGIFACIAAMASFSWQYQPRSTAFTAALPVKRAGLYLSCWLAGFSMLALPAMVTALLSLLVCAATGIAEGLTVLTWLVQDLCVALLFYGLASLCAQLTGTLWVLPAIYTALNFAVAAYWFLLSAVLESQLWGYYMSFPDWAAKLSPAIWLFQMDWEAKYFSNWLGLGLYALFGAVCTVGGLLLLRRRSMESATDTVSVPVLKPVFRWCAAIAAALGLGVLLYVLLIERLYQPLPMTLFMLLGGFIGWLAGEMLARKSYRVRSCLKTFPVFAAVVVVFGVGCAYGGFGYVKHTPAAETVRELEVEYGSSAITLTDPAEIREVMELHRELASAPGQDAGRWLDISYTLDNGTTLFRRYRTADLTEEQEQFLFTIYQRHALEKLNDWLLKARNMQVEVWDYTDDKYHDFYLSADQYRALVPAIRSDVAAGTLNLDGGWYFRASDGEITVDWTFYLASDECADFYFPVSPEAKQTWALLKEYSARSEKDTEKLW